MPFLISSPRMRKTFKAPALATAANGTNRPRIIRVPGLTPFSLGTRALRPSATEQDAETARKYDCTRVEVDIGEDLFALELLIATLRDWFAICHANVPRQPRLGVSMPAVTTRLEITKHDMRNGRKTGSPVSVVHSVK